MEEQVGASNPQIDTGEVDTAIRLEILRPRFPPGDRFKGNNKVQSCGGRLKAIKLNLFASVALPRDIRRIAFLERRLQRCHDRSRHLRSGERLTSTEHPLPCPPTTGSGHIHTTPAMSPSSSRNSAAIFSNHPLSRALALTIRRCLSPQVSRLLLKINSAPRLRPRFRSKNSPPLTSWPQIPIAANGTLLRPPLDRHPSHPSPHLLSLRTPRLRITRPRSPLASI